MRHLAISTPVTGKAHKTPSGALCVYGKHIKQKSRIENMQDLSELIESARQDFAQAQQPAALEDAKAKYIGKTGL